MITAVQIEKVELKFCERIRNRRMRKEDAYMASMQSFAMRASFQLPVEIVLKGPASEVGDIYDLNVGTDRQCPYVGEDKRPISMYVDDERFCDFILRDKRV